MSRLSRLIAVAASLPAMLSANLAHAVAASPTVFYNTLTTGATQFATTVTGANGTVNTDALSGLANSTNTWTRTGFTITASNNVNRTIRPDAGIALNGDGIGMNAGGTGTGLTFTFNAPVNAFAMELEGWATTAWPSSLYIVFDGGTPILVGTANNSSENPGYNDSVTTFIGAIDDSNTFTTVTFYGASTPLGNDALNGGGTIRWANLAIGALSGGGYVNTASSSKGLATYFKDNEVAGLRADLGTYLGSMSQAQVDTAMLSIFPTVGIVGAQTTNNTASQATSLLLDRAGTVLGGQLNGTRNFFQTGKFAPQSAENPDAYLTQAVAGFTGAGAPTGHGAPLVTRLAGKEYPAFVPGEYAVWVEANTGSGQGERTRNTLSYTSDNQGLVMGVETALDAKTLFGILYSPNQGQVKLKDNAGKTDIDTQIGGIYAQRLFGQTKLTGTLNLASSRYNNTRNVDTGTGVVSALADYHGYTATAATGLSRLFTHGGWQVEPFAQAQFIYGHTNGYAEEGAASLNMQAQESGLSQAGLTAGATFQRQWQVTGGKTSHTVRVRPAVKQTFELNGADTNVSLLGTGGSNVLLNANSLTQTELQLGTQYQYAFNPSNAITVGYDTSHNRTQHNHSVMVGYSLRF